MRRTLLLAWSSLFALFDATVARIVIRIGTFTRSSHRHFYQVFVDQVVRSGFRNAASSHPYRHFYQVFVVMPVKRIIVPGRLARPLLLPTILGGNSNENQSHFRVGGSFTFRKTFLLLRHISRGERTVIDGGQEHIHHSFTSHSKSPCQFAVSRADPSSHKIDKRQARNQEAIVSP